MVERFEISKGLDLPIEGEPENRTDLKDVGQVGIVADDYIEIRPTFLVSEGDEVELGQPVFLDKKTEGVVYTAPASGKVVAINRGAKRRFLSMIIDVAASERSREFARYNLGELAELGRDKVAEQIVASGLWLSFRTRPFGRVPSPKTSPQAIFVAAIDTNPLAVKPADIIADASEDFQAGLEVIRQLTDGTVFLCRTPGADTPGEVLQRVRVVEFDGPHPAGLPGTHMHFLKPATLDRINWYLNYQDVIAIGRLFTQGRLDVTRIISLAGPSVRRPRLARTRIGASLKDLVDGELLEGNHRVISGSVFCGRAMQEPLDFLGRYHLQVSCLPEGNVREFLGWQTPGFDKFSVTRAFASAWSAPRKFAMTTSTGGSERAMVPIGTYERVMPLDLLPTLLLRALITNDVDRAQELGCLELDEEDLALCTFVCPGKYEYGEILRNNLIKIEKEG